MACVRCGESFPSKYYYPEQLVARGVLLCRRCFEDLGTPSLPEVLKAYPSFAPTSGAVGFKVKSKPLFMFVNIAALLATFPGVLLLGVDTAMRLELSLGPSLDNTLGSAWLLLGFSSWLFTDIAILLAIACLFGNTSWKSKAVVWFCIALAAAGNELMDMHQWG